MSVISVHLRIHGLVQGVGFRYSMCREARRLGLSGWVRNRHDGSVEALVSGPEEAVLKLRTWSQHGPAGACVERIDEEPWCKKPPIGDFCQVASC